MDPLSRILSGIRLRAPLLSRLKLGASAHVDMETAGGAPFYYVVAGNPHLRVEGVEHVLSPGDVLLFPRWPSHTFWLEGAGPAVSILDLVQEQHLPLWSDQSGLDVPLDVQAGTPPWQAHILCGVFGIEPASTRYLFGEANNFLVFSAKELSLQAWMDASLDLLVREVEQPEPGFAAVAARTLELLLTHLTREWLLHGGEAPAWAQGLRDPRLRGALDALHAEPGRRWTLADLAHRCGQSRSRFAAHFVQVMGETPFHYLRRWRNQVAADLLRDTDHSLAEVAARVGYADVATLARGFREEYGITPSAFRRALTHDS